MDGPSATKSNNLIVIGGIAVVVIVVLAAALLLSSGHGQPGSNTSRNTSGTNSGTGSSTDVIAQAFSSSPTLTGAQLANIIASHTKNIGPMNATYYGTMSTDMVFGNAAGRSTSRMVGNFSEDYMRINNSYGVHMLISNKVHIQNRYINHNISNILSAIAIGLANGTTYGCSKVINSTTIPPSKTYTCFKGQSTNSSPLFNYSNAFGSTPSIKYKLVGKGSVIGIPCDILVGNGTLFANNSYGVPPETVGVRTCVSFKYYVWLNYTTTFNVSASAYNSTSNSTISATAAALNKNVPSNFTALPSNFTWGP
jgi:hypothetical protein